MEPQMYADEFR